MTVDSVEIFRHFAFWRHGPGSRLASFWIVPKNCIFWGATFELRKNLATLVPENLQGFYKTLLCHHDHYTLALPSLSWCQWQTLFFSESTTTFTETLEQYLILLFFSTIITLSPWHYMCTLIYTSHVSRTLYTLSHLYVIIITFFHYMCWFFSSSSDKAPTNKICRRASSEQRPRTRFCHESERFV